VKHRAIHLPTTSSATAIQMLLEVGGWGGGVHILHEASEEEAKPTKAANTHQKPKKTKQCFLAEAMPSSQWLPHHQCWDEDEQGFCPKEPITNTYQLHMWATELAAM